MRPTPLKKVLDCAIEFFNDKDKAYKWWLTKDPNLKGKSPFQVSKEGKGHQFIKMFESTGMRYIG